MIYDSPKLFATSQLPEDGEEGQLAFLSGVGLHQFIGGSWQIIGGGGTATPIVRSYSLAQATLGAEATLYTEENGTRTIKEVTIVSGSEGSTVNLKLISGGTTYYILKDCFFDAYQTSIINMKIPLSAGDVVAAEVTEGPDVAVTVTGITRGTESLIIKAIAEGEQTLYTASANKTITNLVICNVAGDTTTTSLFIKRPGSTAAASTFFNELQTAAGEVVLGEVNTAIDAGSTISINSDKPVTVLIVA